MNLPNSEALVKEKKEFWDLVWAVIFSVVLAPVWVPFFAVSVFVGMLASVVQTGFMIGMALVSVIGEKMFKDPEQ